MTCKEAYDQFENLSNHERQHYSSFEDYLEANNQSVCNGCDYVVNHYDLDDLGYCELCQTENGY
jgi:rubrerythrin